MKRKKSKLPNINSKNCIDDDVPLSTLKNKQTKTEIRTVFKSQKRNNVKKGGKNKVKKKTYTYYKGKKVFTKSDTESSDFDSYTYFDESKVKRKIKIDPNLHMKDVKRQIEDIKMENICLMKEFDRINELKLRERLKLREEILRLKNDILKLEFQNHFTDLSNVHHNRNPYLIIDNLIEGNLRSMENDSIKNVDILKEKIQLFKFTEKQFWEGFNSLEVNLSTHGPLWSGNLDHISPYCDKYFKPTDNIVKELSFNDLMENYPYGGFTWKKQSSRSKQTIIKKGAVVDEDDLSHKMNNDNVSDSEDNIERTDYLECLENKEHQEKFSSKESKSQKDEVGRDKNTDEFQNEMGSNHHVNQSPDHVDSDADGLVCSECGFDNSWSAFISRHREAYQNNVTLKPCNACNLKFLKSGHFSGKHRLKRPPPKKYRSASFMCAECGECCTSKSGLSQHALQHKEAQYACQLCNYKCRRKAYLKIHMKIHSLKMQRNSTTNIKDGKKTKNLDSFICSVCTYTTNKSSSLKSHMNIHTNHKPFSCTYCDYRTFSKSYLKSHINFHTGFKAFKCDKCSYQCVTSTRLNIHRKIHDGIKDYACTMCEYKTTSNFNLKIHFKRHKIDSS